MAKSKKSTDWKALIVSILIAQGAGILGSLFTYQAIPTWYASLVKPSFSPPNSVFGPVWTTLYTLIGISAYLIYKSKKSDTRSHALNVYGLHLGINALWSIVFFGFRSPTWGFGVILALWMLIIYLMFQFSKISTKASLLLLPYLLWVSFASLLNLAIMLLN